MLDNLLRKHNNSHDVITFLQIFKTCELNIGQKKGNPGSYLEILLSDIL